MTFIYGVVVFLATILGAMSGMGGGIIMKPAFDFIAYHDVSSISFYSSCAVFSMALVNVGKQIHAKKKYDIKTIVLISLGSSLGGYLGSQLFAALLSYFNSRIVRASQSMLLILVLFLVLYLVMSEKMTYKVTSKMVVLSIGIVLGMLSSYLGIGGGPLNVAVFSLMFSVDFKTATAYSIASILFSQLASIITTGVIIGYERFDLSMLAVIIPTACFGGWIGSKLNHELSVKTLKRVFNGVISALILLNFYNFLSL